jgi:hypothetical protein
MKLIIIVCLHVFDRTSPLAQGAGVNGNTSAVGVNIKRYPIDSSHHTKRSQGHRVSGVTGATARKERSDSN